jgi:hypothetical protein
MGSLFVSCATTSSPAAPPYSYSGDKPIYPAVYYAVKNGTPSNWEKAEIEVSSDGTETFVRHVQTADGIRLADFTVKVAVVDGVVQYQASEIFVKMPGTPDAPRQVDSFSQSSATARIANYLNTEIPKIMEDEAQYAAAREESDAALGRAIRIALQNPNDRLIYPAVGKALAVSRSSVGDGAHFSKTDCLDNNFTIRRCSAFRGTFITYTIDISVQNGSLIFAFGNIDTDVGSLMNSNANPPNYDPKGTAEKLAKEINTILGDSSAYEKARAEVLGDNDFLYPTLNSITSILEDEFIQTVLKGVPIVIDVTISEVTQNSNSEYTSYAYEVRGMLYVTTRDAGSYASVRLYTNKRDYTRLGKLEHTQLSGTLDTFKTGIGSQTLIMID